MPPRRSFGAPPALTLGGGGFDQGYQRGRVQSLQSIERIRAWLQAHDTTCVTLRQCCCPSGLGICANIRWRVVSWNGPKKTVKRYAAGWGLRGIREVGPTTGGGVRGVPSAPATAPPTGGGAAPRRPAGRLGLPEFGDPEWRGAFCQRSWFAPPDVRRAYPRDACPPAACPARPRDACPPGARRAYAGDACPPGARRAYARGASPAGSCA